MKLYENEVNKTKMNTLNLSHVFYINAHIEVSYQMTFL